MAAKKTSWLATENLLYVLLVFVPLALVLHFVHASPVAVFVTSALAIIPLAGLMGRSTEELSEHLGEAVGGLLNATFGNAAELIIALMALRAGLHDVVKASLTGSIIGNILLVLGLAIVAGGARRESVRFNATAAAVSTTLLMLSAIGLVVPTVFHELAAGRAGVREGQLSLEIAVVLFLTYLLSLLFTLKTHKHLYTTGDGARSSHHGEPGGRARPLTILLVSTAFVAVMSELLVSTVEHAADALGMTEVFVGVILVAIIGNAAEHSTAILVALKNKMDLAMNIAVGSSLQIALFVAPVLVFSSYAFGTPMDLHFSMFEVLAVVVSTLVVRFIASDGESNWMEGVQLLAVYVILGMAFYFLPGA